MIDGFKSASHSAFDFSEIVVVVVCFMIDGFKSASHSAFDLVLPHPYPLPQHHSPTTPPPSSPW